MKTILHISIVSILLLFTIFQLSIAQGSKLTFGVHAGVGISFHSDNEITPDGVKSSGLSYYGGGVMNIALGDTWSFQPELLYTFESAKRSDIFYRPNDSGTMIISKEPFTTNHVVTSFSVPLLVKLSIGETKAGQVNIVAGPTVNYTISAKDSVVFDPITPYHPNQRGSTNWSKSTDIFQLGFSIGAAGRIFDHIFVEARYHYNITNHIDIAGYHASFSNVMIGAGYMF